MSSVSDGKDRGKFDDEGEGQSQPQEPSTPKADWVDKELAKLMKAQVTDEVRAEFLAILGKPSPTFQYTCPQCLGKFLNKNIEGSLDAVKEDWEKIRQEAGHTLSVGKANGVLRLTCFNNCDQANLFTYFLHEYKKTASEGLKAAWEFARAVVREERKHGAKKAAKKDQPVEITAPEKEAAEAQLKAEAEAALAASQHLLDDPHLMRPDPKTKTSRIDEALAASGLAGERRNAKLVYLAFTSRVGPRPVNTSVEGPSAAGKTYLVEKVSKLFPTDAVYYMTGSSEHLIAYTDAEFTHRFIWVAEAPGLTATRPDSQSQGKTLWRELIWSNKLVYETLEKEGGKIVAVRMEKDGPTGLITTSTRKLDNELATRMLPITMRDDPAQTKAVMKETAKQHAAGKKAAPSLEAFVALQRWLELAGIKTAVVPFGDALAEEMVRLTPNIGIRARRDFVQLLNLIMASAILHQRQRKADEFGNVVATLEDYRIVRGLIAETLEANLTEGGITKAQRQAVVALAKLYEETKDHFGDKEPVTAAQVGKALGIDRTSALRRLRAPIERGFVEDQDAGKKGKPHRYSPGEPMPPEARALPTLEEIEAHLLSGGNQAAQLHTSEKNLIGGLSEPASSGAVGSAVQSEQGQAMEEPVEPGEPSLHCTPPCTTTEPQDRSADRKGSAVVHSESGARGTPNSTGRAEASMEDVMQRRVERWQEFWRLRNEGRLAPVECPTCFGNRWGRAADGTIQCLGCGTTKGMKIVAIYYPAGQHWYKQVPGFRARLLLEAGELSELVAATLKRMEEQVVVPVLVTPEDKCPKCGSGTFWRGRLGGLHCGGCNAPALSFRKR